MPLKCFYFLSVCILLNNGITFGSESRAHPSPSASRAATPERRRNPQYQEILVPLQSIAESQKTLAHPSAPSFPRTILQSAAHEIGVRLIVDPILGAALPLVRPLYKAPLQEWERWWRTFQQRLAAKKEECADYRHTLEQLSNERTVLEKDISTLETELKSNSINKGLLNPLRKNHFEIAQDLETKKNQLAHYNTIITHTRENLLRSHDELNKLQIAYHSRKKGKTTASGPVA